MNIVETVELTKSYQQGDTTIHALDHVNLKIKSADFAALVGPSGSGKTTLLNMIGGLDTPSSGQIIVADIDFTACKPKQLSQIRRDTIGFVFQSYNLIPVLTAKENTEFILDLQGKSAEDKTDISLKVLERVGLKGFENRRPDQLSGGQQQRVAVARAIAAAPSIVLADEPTANLDSKNAESLMDLMLQLNQEEGITFLFSTHDERVIRRARRKITLVDGKISDDIIVG